MHIEMGRYLARHSDSWHWGVGSIGIMVLRMEARLVTANNGGIYYT